MALKAWQEIAASAIDRDSPVTEELITKFHNNQECLISMPTEFSILAILHKEITSTSYAFVAGKSMFIPQACGTLDGDVELVLNIAAWIVTPGGGSGDMRARIDGGTWTEVNVTTTTEYVYADIRISASDVRSAAGTIVVVELWARRTAPATAIRLFGESSANRFERIA